MHLTKLVIFFAVFDMRICLAGLITEKSYPVKSLVEASVDILEFCYTNRIGTVGLAGDSIRSIAESISLRDVVIPVTLIDETSRAVNHEPIDRGSRQKLQVFVITVTDSNVLVKILTQVKNSKWWNHMASFLLIDLSEMRYGCSNARKILWESWKMNLLNSKFMCHHQTRGRLIYTFNPYTSKASVPWQLENTYKGKYNHVWTLFAKEYREDESRCDGLDFDKTLDLGGYVIRASVVGMETWWYDNPNVKPTVGNRISNVTAQILIDALNATWKWRLHVASNRALRDWKGDPRGVSVEVINGSSDICLNILNHHVWINHETTYPFSATSLAVITQYRGHKSQLDKLISVLDRRSRFCVLVVILITLLFFKFHLHEPLISAILNLVLILCSAALQKIPKNLAPRIYLGSLFILVVTIQGIYQGKLASLLTKPVRLSAINSIDDLARSNHTIYGLNSSPFFSNQSAFEGRYTELLNRNCTGYVLRDPKAACSGEKIRLISDAAKFALHLSHEPMGTIYGVYLIRPDWPLEERVNTIYGRAVAGDVMKPLYAVELESAINTLKSYENEDEDQKLRPLSMGQLTFAFVILAIGLICATVSFIIEVSYYGTKIADLRSRVRRSLPRIA